MIRDDPRIRQVVLRNQIALRSLYLKFKANVATSIHQLTIGITFRLYRQLALRNREEQKLARSSAEGRLVATAISVRLILDWQLVSPADALVRLVAPLISQPYLDGKATKLNMFCRLQLTQV